jgi:hypothetical protein
MEKEVINPNINKIVRVEFFLNKIKCGFCAYRKWVFYVFGWKSI